MDKDNSIASEGSKRVKKSLGKLEQYHLLKGDPFVQQHLPETVSYTKENLIRFANQYPVVFIKHDTSGQGRGVYRLAKKSDHFYSLKGYSLQGNEVDEVMNIDEIHKVLQPFERFGRTQPYVIQEGINSVSVRGQHVNIRVHVQHVNGTALVGGIYGSIDYKENGITNIRRGSFAVSMGPLLFKLLELKKEQQQDVLNKLSELSVAAAQVTARHYPSRECGVDLGLDENLKPFIFEVNITPGIGGFTMVDKQMWKRIVENRKKMKDSVI